MLKKQLKTSMILLSGVTIFIIVFGAFLQNWTINCLEKGDAATTPIEPPLEPDILTATRYGVDWNPDEEELRRVARNFDNFHSHGDVKITGEWARIMKKENPNMLIGFYKNIESLSDTYDSDLVDRAKDYWFLRDAEGKIIRDPDYPELRLLDLGLKEVQTEWANSCKRYFEETPEYDWVMADVCTPYYPRWLHPINPRTGSKYTQEQWWADRVEFLNTVKSVIGNKLLIPNVGRPKNCIETRASYDGILNAVDGVLFEGGLVRDFNPNRWLTEDEWLSALELVREALKEDKYVIFWVVVRERWGTVSWEQIALYGLASYLLVKEGTKAYFCARNDAVTGDPEWYPNQYKGKVGDPVGEYYKLSDIPVYVRNYTKAKVLVNPSPNTYTITLEQPYKTIEGQTVTKVTLTDHTGIILLREVSPTPPTFGLYEIELVVPEDLPRLQGIPGIVVEGNVESSPRYGTAFEAWSNGVWESPFHEPADTTLRDRFIVKTTKQNAITLSTYDWVEWTAPMLPGTRYSPDP